MNIRLSTTQHMARIRASVTSFRLPSMAAYAVGLVFSKMLALLLQPLLTRWLTPEEFGDYAVLITLANLVSVIMLVGMVDCLYRFAHQELSPAPASQSANKRLSSPKFDGIWTTTVMASSAITLPLLIWPSVIADWLPGTLSDLSVRCLMLSVLLSTHSALQLARLRMEDKAKPFLIIQLLFATVQCLFIVVLTPVSGVDGIMIASLIANAVQWLLLHRDMPGFSLGQWQQFVRYGSGIMVSGVIGFVTLGAERWVLGGAVGTAELAVYAIAMQWALAATLLLEPYGMWWFPKRFSSVEKDQRYTADMSVFGCQLATVIAALLIVIGCPFLTLWLPENYHQASEILPLLAWVMWFKYLSTQLNLGIYADKTADTAAGLSALCALIAVGLMLTLIPVFGLYGAVIMALLSQVIRFGLFLYVSQRRLHLPYRYKDLIVCGIALAAITFIQLHASDRLSVYLSSALLTIFAGGLVFYIYRSWQRYTHAVSA
ncbi:lipopolysaccharide biosynthesis protein [Thaumasiovibrio subtropicus]|uniref:lipopolysaccharide biosynthesis protein n=1 Tax=Thaumasiovibrio subtropicus TaxID=1891207 RepID=UPI000B35CADB|nr:lipopolysaccharide biosynthesis protein [Thaumasiovibrio subtropicus]